MARGRVRGIAFDMCGTVVDVGAVAEACKAVAPDPVAFNTQWRAQAARIYVPSKPDGEVSGLLEGLRAGPGVHDPSIRDADQRGATETAAGGLASSKPLP